MSAGLLACLTLDSLPTWPPISHLHDPGLCVYLTLESLPVWTQTPYNYMTLDSLYTWPWSLYLYGPWLLSCVTLGSLYTWPWSHYLHGPWLLTCLTLESMYTWPRNHYRHVPGLCVYLTLESLPVWTRTPNLHDPGLFVYLTLESHYLYGTELLILTGLWTACILLFLISHCMCCPPECYTGIGEDYRGHVARTDFGTPCISWAQTAVNHVSHPGKVRLGRGPHMMTERWRNEQEEGRCWWDEGLQSVG